VNAPLIAVTTTVYVPGVEDDTVNMELAVPPDGSDTLAGLREAETTVGAEAERAIVPLNRLMLVRVIVAVPDEPDVIVRLAGLGDMRKSFAPFVILQLSV